MVLVGHRHRAGGAQQDERPLVDARRGEDRLSGGVGEGEGMTTTKPLGAQFEISIDGTPRTYRDDKAIAIEAAENLKRKHPHSAVTVENLQTGEKTAVEYKPDLGPR
jgi:hypothetical protein